MMQCGHLEIHVDKWKFVWTPGSSYRQPEIRVDKWKFMWTFRIFNVLVSCCK